MPSAYQDRIKGGWIADFRGVHQHGKDRRRVRIPAQRCPSAAEANAYAQECERYARIIEGVPTAADIDHAEDLKVLSHAQAVALREARVMPPTGRAAASGPWRLEAAACAHPSTKREQAANPADYTKHLRQLAAYAAWAGSDLLADVTLERVLQWCDELRRRELSWDTRRHYLLYLRRATQMGATVARLPDPIAGIKIDRQDQQRDIEVWPLSALIAAAQHLAASHLQLEQRAAGVIALGGCMGLRPTEICRLQVGDVDGDVLRVGVRERKNSASRRDLPIPAPVLPWITALALDAKTGQRRQADGALVRSLRGGHLQPHAFDDWWRNYVRPHLVGDELGPKHLRKSFATWATASPMSPPSPAGTTWQPRA